MSASRPAANGRSAAPVGLAPLQWLLPRLAVFLLAWSVLRAGRGVCLVAQRFPPAVWLVRAVYAWKDRRAQARAERTHSGVDGGAAASALVSGQDR